MKFEVFNSMIDWKYFFLLPSIVFLKDDPVLMVHNFSIRFHWLGFHLRWRWIEKESK